MKIKHLCLEPRDYEETLKNGQLSTVENSGNLMDYFLNGHLTFETLSDCQERDSTNKC